MQWVIIFTCSSRRQAPKQRAHAVAQALQASMQDWNLWLSMATMFCLSITKSGPAVLSPTLMWQSQEEPAGLFYLLQAWPLQELAEVVRVMEGHKSNRLFLQKAAHTRWDCRY